MKKAIFTEIAWFAGLFITAVLLSGWFFSNNALDVRDQDTYHSDGSKFSSLGPIQCMFFLALGFGVYFIRAIFSRFKIFSVCIGLVFFSLLGLGTLEYSLYNFYHTFSSVYWANSGPAAPVKGLFYGGDMSVVHDIRVLVLIKAFLTLCLAFTSLMIGRLHRGLSLRQ